MTGALLQFGLCALLIARAGWTLSHSADRLAAIQGWGRGWVGLALLGTVTSLPELASGISAVAVVGAPNLAVGNALGACVVNLGFLVVVDALQRDQPMYRAAAATHVLSAAFGVVLLGLAALAMLAGTSAPTVMNLGLASPLLLGGYLLALRSVQAQGAATDADADAAAGAADDPERQREIRREWQRFAIAAAVVLAAGSALPYAADRVAEAAGWSRSFVGTVFMAVATTLPEMAVTLGALRLGALDLAIGNLLGSNLFNVTILAVDDLFHPGGPLLAAVAPVHVGTAVTAMTMAGGVLVGLVMRPQGRVLRVLSWVSVGLLAGVLVNALLLALAGDSG
ncbi:sodium:calcium antiporter [Rubrivivax albus]|uniref:Sodium:calcium antiporter n=1 Tax=Rubrivivax albus TaxID=2499835 RepID=A0A437JSS9_9BURK|nr:sodium:calcium antiporter [Rubrivivax albus]RVT50098.1 sodium:calcium antiporter [Rubrivivax albus]